MRDGWLKWLNLKESGEPVWTLMIGPEGGIEMIAGADEPLDTLLVTRGARAAWRVRRERGVVRVEGRMGKGAVPDRAAGRRREGRGAGAVAVEDV